jgi:transcriptional regulator with PAS, ATPase and Fis domain
MIDKKTEKLLKHLTELCKKLSGGRYGRADELFEFTKESVYPPIVAELAEAFGMMTVKIDAREFRLEQMVDELKKANTDLSAAKKQLLRENVNMKNNLREKYSPSRILGKSSGITEVLRKVEKLANTRANVLITGETGTGKELVAKALHYNSSRSSKPFVAINCTAIPESIFESEMFGIEKGVATGVEKRMGKMEQADGGTLFLDEIGDMPAPCQSKMLRAIEEQSFDRVGGRKRISVDVRIVSATHRKLTEEVRKGTFREDLFYRLNVVNIDILPLRERKDDILLLANASLEQSIMRLNKGQLKFSPEVLRIFKDYAWPGNVRELENEVERAAILSYADTITPDDLSETLRKTSNDTGVIPKNLSTAENEKMLIIKTLAETGGNRSESARLLDISREGLRKKMKRYNIA